MSAQSAISRGAYRQAFLMCCQIIEQQADFADAWFLKSVVAAAQGGIYPAVQWARKASLLDAGNAEYLAHQAQYLSMLKRHSEATVIADESGACKNVGAIQLDILAGVYSKAGDHKKALFALKKAVSMQKKNPFLYFNLAANYQILGNFPQAKQNYEQVINLQPDFYRAYWALSGFPNTDFDAHLLTRLLHLLSGPRLGPKDELMLCHAVAREYERRGDAVRAFSYLRRGKLKQSRKLAYNFESDREIFTRLANKVTEQSLTRVRPSSHTQAPIFVVGMPGTGITLMEGILEGHSQVTSLGEVQNFGAAVKRAANSKADVVLDASVIDAFERTDFDEVGSRYLSSLKAYQSPGGSVRFVNKLSLNFFYIGHILTALPEAKIICMRRNASDTCRSSYKQLFASKSADYNYAFNLEDTAEYYLQFDQLIRHWRKLFGGRIMEVAYEELVDTPESVSWDVMKYCGLPWEDDCLKGYNSQRAVSCNGPAKVSKAIFKTTVDSLL
ncbi:MAG: sulfotransferase [Pseudomonadales bacterium]|nr:sulfotransferase [Pseudomonadales bacterium]